MKIINVFLPSVVVLFSLAVVFDAHSEESKQLSPESLMGKYEGRMQVHNPWQKEYDYQTEIISVNTSANTVSLTVQCRDCETREWKRKNCAIREAKENITFACKTKFGDEVYIFNGKSMKATGVGIKYPYTISVTKVVK
jgi:hypothetical protein